MLYFIHFCSHMQKIKLKYLIYLHNTIKSYFSLNNNISFFIELTNYLILNTIYERGVNIL